MGLFGVQALQVIVTASSKGKEFVFGHGSGSSPSTQGAADYTIREPVCKIGMHPPETPAAGDRADARAVGRS